MSHGKHTKADISAIRSMGSGLKRVKKAFDGISSIKGRYGDALGDGDLADALEDFASNWEDHRKDLTKEVEALSKITTAAADAYDKIEHALVESLAGDKSGGKKKGERR